jgi:hypothetical protein
MAVRQVYFIQARTLGHVKIGISADASRRIADLQVGCPDELVVRGVFLVEDAEAFETMFHSRFAHLHIRGEWFRNDRELEGVMQNAFSLPEVAARRLPVLAMGNPPREPGSRRLHRATGESTEAFIRRATRWANKRLDEMEAAAA